MGLAFTHYSLHDWLAWLRGLIFNPFALVITAFWLWMFVDAIRRQEWVWVFFLVIGSGITAMLYYFFVYRAAPSGRPRGDSSCRKRVRPAPHQAT